MKLAIPSLSVADYARSLRADGARVVEKEGFWWREVRPFFFRPALPFQVPPAGATPPTWRAAVGGFQHVVAEGDGAANSALEFLVFRDADRYRLDELKAGRRWEVRSAAKRFVIRPITEPGELAESGHEVYLSFFERTRYSYLSERVRKSRFEQWVQAVFREAGALVLGAYAGGKLVAVSVSRVVAETFFYSTFFARYEAMREHVSSLMLHTVREAARECDGVRTVFAGMRKTGEARTVDDFYLLRGAVVELRPARLRINPGAAVALRLVRPQLLRQLQGEQK